MPSPFYNARLVEFTAQVRMWPVVIRSAANGETATCIRTPDKVAMQMQGNSYQKMIQTTVDMLREDAVRLALYITAATPRPRFAAGGNTYEINPWSDDKNEPTVQFTANKVQ